MTSNKNLFIVSLILIVNTLGYGIIIPVFYAYSQKYGLNDFQNGLLFSAYSIAQFLSTPIIGRASDKYGRRPLLILSLAGTALSFFMMAFAPNAWFLFFARALDGATAGNIPVASAVIADTTEPKDRAKAFGIISGAFNFGFIFGPLISTLTVGISLETPFIIAGVITAVSVVMTMLMLPETNKVIGKIKNEPLFDFHKLAMELKNPKIGRILLITLIYSTAFGMFIYAFQPYALKELHMKEADISMIFVLFGVIGLLMQFFGIEYITKKFGTRKLYSNSFALLTLAFAGLFFSKSIIPFVLVSAFLSLSNSAIFPLTQTMLSQSADETEQGSVQGINSSYMSIGQIIGPIIAGAVAGYAIGVPFLGGAALILLCYMLSQKIIAK